MSGVEETNNKETLNQTKGLMKTRQFSEMSLHAKVFGSSIVGIVLFFIATYNSVSLGVVEAFISSFLSALAGAAINYVVIAKVENRRAEEVKAKLEKERVEDRIAMLLPVFHTLHSLFEGIAKARSEHLRDYESILIFLEERLHNIRDSMSSISSQLSKEEDTLLKERFHATYGSDINSILMAREQRMDLFNNIKENVSEMRTPYIANAGQKERTPEISNATGDTKSKGRGSDVGGE